MTGSVSRDVAELLEAEAARINHPDFIDEDPVQFPRRFSDLRDIEIAALLTAAISWGKRKMILRDADRMLALMDHQPYRYVMDEGYEDLDPDMNIHRTFFGRHMQWYLRTLKRVYDRYPSLDAFCAANIDNGASCAPWLLAESLGKLGEEVNGSGCSQCVPTNIAQTALKRINMALRWLVRNDGIVDMGVWKSLTPADLYLPLDVHVGNTARSLGLLTRKANDRKSTESLTGLMRTLRPEDPVLFDYALFGIGVEGKNVDGLQLP